MVHQYSTTNPYVQITIPAIGRIWQALQDIAAELNQRTFQIGVRGLAARAGLASAGGVSHHLKQLEADGHITYDPTLSLVMISAEIDQGADRPVAVQPTETRTGKTSDQHRDRVKPAYKVHESHESEERGESRSRSFETADQEAKYQFLLTQEKVTERGAWKCVTQGYQGTLEELQTDIRRASHMRGVHSPVLFVMRNWIDGFRVPEASKETPRHDELETNRRQPAAQTPVRPRRPIDHTPPGAEIVPMRPFEISW